jgi:flagellar protein FlbD
MRRARGAAIHLHVFDADRSGNGAGDADSMIYLTRLNGNPLVVNSDLIKYAEAAPDTVLTLVNGEKIVVLEGCEEVIGRTVAYRARVFGEAAGYLQALAWTPAPEASRGADAKLRTPNDAAGPQD